MKKMMVRMPVILMLVGVFCLSAITAKAQGAQDFLLINKTGVEINALYITPHNADDWGDDILGADTLAADESLEITFSPRERAQLWDLRVEDEDGAYIEWTRLNLIQISSVTLYYKNGKATAIVK
jgi:hypothetical protein